MKTSPGKTSVKQSTPPESLVQAIWYQQRILRDCLVTINGVPVRVLHPGFKNYEAGPDFRNAVIKIGDGPAQTGDVEVDAQAGFWKAHGHDRNPAFKQVILRVVWDECEPGRDDGPPVTAISGKLDAPFEELNLWLGRDSLAGMPEGLRGKCCEPLRGLTQEKLKLVLRHAARARFRAKANQLQARARQAGWEQSLWEGIFRALGYKQNTWPMQVIAEMRPALMEGVSDAVSCQARFLGVGGLLPAELPRARGAADVYLRRVWDQWWRERGDFEDRILPRDTWRFNNLRPANHPQRRLALGAHWIASGDFTQRLEKWFVEPVGEGMLVESLLKVLQVQEDKFWSWHWTFGSARLPRPQPLPGKARVTDLAINVILPWLWIRAVEGRNEELRRTAEQRYLAWPAAEDNSILKMARQRLLGGTRPVALRSAAAQQGMLQIVRDYCEHSNALCENCQFPRVVENFLNDRMADEPAVNDCLSLADRWIV
jgi:hypothetical protein